MYVVAVCAQSSGVVAREQISAVWSSWKLTVRPLQMPFGRSRGAVFEFNEHAAMALVACTPFSVKVSEVSFAGRTRGLSFERPSGRPLRSLFVVSQILLLSESWKQCSGKT